MTIDKSVLVLRALAPLEASGAFDTSPVSTTECKGSSFVQFHITYQRGAAGGRMAFAIEGSIDGSDWYRLQVIDPSSLSGGQLDTADLAVRLPTSTADTNRYAIAQDVSGFKYVRVLCKETGVTATPGSASVLGVFSNG